MKKLRKRKMPNGRAKAVWGSQIAPKPLRRPVGANSFSNGMNATWIGIINSATTRRKIPSRNGKFSHENAYAAIDARATGMIGEGTAIRAVFKKKWSMPCEVRTAE